jgi:hypothetical protein
MLREELRIKDARMAAVLPHRRPHYPPIMRMAILELKAARGWNLAQASQRFLVEPSTIAAWFRRLEESGPAALVQIVEPVNKFPLFVRRIVARLKALCPAIGKVKIAQTLARAGLHLGATTVKRMLAGEDGKPKHKRGGTELSGKDKPDRAVTAKYPNHVWHVDLTVMPTGGFRAPWPPFALPQCWPFCWWLAVVLDHFSRKVCPFRQPRAGRPDASGGRPDTRSGGCCGTPAGSGRLSRQRSEARCWLGPSDWQRAGHDERH